MNWFLVLLFWNPAVQSYDVADGWYPIPYATEVICDMKRDYVSMYLPALGTAEKPHMVGCVPATDMWSAIAKAKDVVNE